MIKDRVLVQELEEFYPPANRYAGKVVDMGNREITLETLEQMKKEYLSVFEAFLAGVAYAKKLEKEKNNGTV